MNIFILDKNTVRNAKAHCNTHVIKMTQYRASFNFGGKLFVLPRINNNKKQMRRIKKFKENYFTDSTWFDLYNNGEIK